MRTAIVIIGLFLYSACYGQYAPAAGMPGTTAIYQDSSVFSAWATSVVVERGWINISDTTKGKASFGNAGAAAGKADNNPVSLGDGGTAVLSFDKPIVNGAGWDFAVFENSFDGMFLELAFVEVSSDGQNFFRFPAHSLTQDTVQVGPFGTLEPTKLHNLAGKYKAGYGTPFDLEEMKGIAGLDINNIVKIRIIDVVGSINPQYATYDTAGNAVNDPWPVNYPSSGFDLDAVGVIHNITNIEKSSRKFLAVFPNPAGETLNIRIPAECTGGEISIFDINGECVMKKTVITQEEKYDITKLAEGIYFIELSTRDGKVFVNKFLKKY